MAKNSKKTSKSKKGLGWSERILYVFILLGSLSVMPTSVFFVVAMIPTLVAFFVDHEKRKMSAYSIGALNLAATLSYLVQIWSNGHDMSVTMQYLVNPTTLMIIYACSWVGWVLHFFIPPFIAEFVRKNGERRLNKIKQQQKKIIEEWGEAVTGENAQNRVIKSRREMEIEEGAI